MLEKVFTKENVVVNAFLSAVIFLVYIIFLGDSIGESLTTSFIFFGILFVFDWIVELFRGRG